MTVRDKQPLDQCWQAVLTLHWCQHNSGVCWLPQFRFPESGVTWWCGNSSRVTEQAREQGIRCFCGYGLTELPPQCVRKKPTVWQTSVRRCGSGSENRKRRSVAAGCQHGKGYWRNGQLVPLVNDEGWCARAIAVRCIMAS